MTTHKIIGERIKNLRQLHNLTREEVAEKAEISSKFLYEIEKGTKGLSADTLLRIARTLSCSCDYILTGEDYETPVSYWMPFNGNIGLHDADWRASFGGTLYKNNGSHGCVNLPPKAAQLIYEQISAGDPVLCYHLEGTESKTTTKASDVKVGGSPSVTKPTETKPAETKPVETKPAVTRPVETTPAPTTAAPTTEIPTTTVPETQIPETSPIPETTEPETSPAIEPTEPETEALSQPQTPQGATEASTSAQTPQGAGGPGAVTETRPVNQGPGGPGGAEPDYSAGPGATAGSTEPDNYGPGYSGGPGAA